MVKLVYHQNDFKQSLSPFDSEIISMATDNKILIVSPYINLSYLKKRIIKVAKNWQLITDMQEWLLSHNITERIEII